MFSLRSHKALHLFLATTLLVAQALLYVHQLELDQHASGDNCQLCLHASSISGSLGASNELHLPELASDAALAASATSVVLRQSFSPAQPRAPPLSVIN